MRERGGDAFESVAASFAERTFPVTRSRFSRIRTALAATALLLVAAGWWAAPSALADDPPAPPGTPTAHTIDGLKTVGPLFREGSPTTMAARPAWWPAHSAT